MRISKKHVRMAQTVTILTFLLIASPLINSAGSSLQQELSIQNTANVLIQNNFADKIFFEYGAESGVLQPPWDKVGAVGYPSSTIIDDSHARSGTYSMKLYQGQPTKTEKERRVSNRLYSTDRKEFYVSWWVYFDSQWDNQDSWSTLGGWQTFFGPSGEDPAGKWRWWTGGRFQVHGNGYLQFAYGWGKAEGASDFSANAESIEQSWATSYYVSDYYDQWVHFQVYVKMANGTDGTVTAWFNNNLVANKTGIKTDPSGYSEFTSNNCIWANNPYPWIVIELYQDTTSFESWIWVDDVVAATEKIPQSYGVIDK